MNKFVNFKVRVMHMYMRKRNLTPEQFHALDEKHDILGYINDCGEWLYLMGDDGILDEIDKLVGAAEVTST